MFQPWLKLAVAGTFLAFEAQEVILRRMMRLAAGGPVATTEAERMVTEKAFAAGEAVLASALAFQRSGGRPAAAASGLMRPYRKRVRANRRRLRRAA